MAEVQGITLPVMIRTVTKKEKGAVFYIPEMGRHWNRGVQREINNRINEMVRQLQCQQYVEQDVTAFEQMIGTYEVKTT